VYTIRPSWPHYHSDSTQIRINGENSLLNMVRGKRRR